MVLMLKADQRLASCSNDSDIQHVMSDCDHCFHLSPFVYIAFWLTQLPFIYMLCITVLNYILHE
jgi:hypothetical protein